VWALEHVPIWPGEEPTDPQDAARALPDCCHDGGAASAFAWGDKGHEIIAFIAEHYLDPAGRARVVTLPAADTDTLTDQDTASEATWADKYRTATGTRPRSTTKERDSGTSWTSNSPNRTLPQPASAIRRYLPGQRPPTDRHGFA
jgi:hypothetical protein